MLGAWRYAANTSRRRSSSASRPRWIANRRCRVALLNLHRRGAVQLPEPAWQGRFSAKRPLGAHTFCEPPAVEVALDALGKVELVAVGSRHSAHAHIWKALMERYHDRGSAPL